MTGIYIFAVYILTIIMLEREQQQSLNRYLLKTKSLFIVSIAVVTVTLLGVWMLGVGQHRTLFENSMLSTSILSIAFFAFITAGLYFGIKLRDDVGKITDGIKISRFPDLSGMSGDFDLDGGDDLGGIIIAIFSWIIVSILAIIVIWAFSAILWAGILVFIAMLYWIFFRALRLVFKNANRCRGKLINSAVYGLGYTILYNFWIYGIILGAHYVL